MDTDKVMNKVYGFLGYLFGAVIFGGSYYAIVTATFCEKFLGTKVVFNFLGLMIDSYKIFLSYSVLALMALAGSVFMIIGTTKLFEED